MTALQRRIFIAIDEWLGIITLLYMHDRFKAAFLPTLIAWVIFIYGISYPWHWYLQYKESSVVTIDVEDAPIKSNTN